MSGLDKALTPEEKNMLYEAIGYQEQAEEGILEYPKRSDGNSCFFLCGSISLIDIFPYSLIASHHNCIFFDFENDYVQVHCTMIHRCLIKSLHF